MITGVTILWECVHCLAGSAFGHVSIAPGFEAQLGYVRRVFHLSFHFITFGGHSAHSDYHMHKSALKTAIFKHVCNILTVKCFRLKLLLIKVGTVFANWWQVQSWRVKQNRLQKRKRIELKELRKNMTRYLLYSVC